MGDDVWLDVVVGYFYDFVVDVVGEWFVVDKYIVELVDLVLVEGGGYW